MVTDRWFIQSANQYFRPFPKFLQRKVPRWICWANVNQSIWRSQVSSRRLYLNAYSEYILYNRYYYNSYFTLGKTLQNNTLNSGLYRAEVDQFKQCHPLQCSSQSQQSTDSIGPSKCGPWANGGPQKHSWRPTMAYRWKLKKYIHYVKG